MQRVTSTKQNKSSAEQILKLPWRDINIHGAIHISWLILLHHLHYLNLPSQSRLAPQRNHSPIPELIRQHLHRNTGRRQIHRHHKSSCPSRLGAGSSHHRLADPRPPVEEHDGAILVLILAEISVFDSQVGDHADVEGGVRVEGGHIEGVERGGPDSEFWCTDFHDGEAEDQENDWLESDECDQICKAL